MPVALYINSSRTRSVLLTGISAVMLIGSYLPFGSYVAYAATESEFSMLPAFEVELVSPLGSPGSAKVQPSVGDEVQLRVRNAQSGLLVELPPFEDKSKQEGWILRAQNSQPSSSAQKAVPQAQALIFTVGLLKPGQLLLPSLALKDPVLSKWIGRTIPFSLNVASAIQPNDPKPDQPENIEPPVGLEFPKKVIIGMGIIGLAILAGVCYLIFRWWKQKAGALKKTSEIYKSEDEIALEELARLQKSNLIGEGRLKAHYFKISEILKIYLGARFHMNAVESTTQELLNQLNKNQLLSHPAFDELQSIFERLDLVKFTDSIPPVEEPAQLIQEARALIVKTRRPQASFVLQAGVSQNAAG